MAKPVDSVNQSTKTPPDEVFEALHEVMHLYRTQRQRAMAGAAQALPEMEGRVLRFFGRHPGATLSDLVAHSGRDKSQLARLIAGLRDKELLEARADEADRRNVRLYPTPAAEEMQRTMREQLRKVARSATADLDAGECAELVRLLGRIRDRLAGAR